ncbi:nucleotidyltransferase domain-containing protein [Bacillus aquiflavi]|uniref:Nucleotidyltransferase domain-containing protein n=1 Tax=Bacillus aquiflavi TaxID=2672567 RepID=A0A6B3W461_9BACI|nr:nucleotidyltransferase domain-containing protein [Bacillus aquiflavi]MBA4538008.1 nucleotidyltransferase domain-containing protein [Bacillus aquiflavi]NEY82264.1 nucleotidyltransferase domain-containing protein [Bacillus aquiflavi]
MKNIIVQRLKEIETEENVKIVYACESGSRAWGFPSKDSDYDVRFIYVHPPEWYLSIFDKRDVIERPINDLLDINGWDLRKALQLFRKSNPPLLEWLQSPIKYDEKYTIAEKLRQYSASAYSRKACIYHYLNMAKRNNQGYLQGEEVKIKKYFYVLRPILAAMWIERFATIPPIEFDSLVRELLPAGELVNQIEILLARKKAGEELDLEPKINIIHDFIHKQFSYLEDQAKAIPAKMKENDNYLDQFFRNALKEVFND